MAALPELRGLCEELGIESEDLLIDDMKQKIRDRFDEIYKDKKIVGTSEFSKALIKFITEEYDYLLRDKDYKRHYWKEI